MHMGRCISSCSLVAFDVSMCGKHAAYVFAIADSAYSDMMQV